MCLTGPLLTIQANMMTMPAFKISSLLLCSCCAMVYAHAEQDPPAMQAEQEAAASVNVQGIRDPDWKPYSAMLKGVGRFEEKHALAPVAELKFMLQPRRADVDMRALELRLESEDASVPIPLLEGNIFTLPAAPASHDAKAELTLNRKSGSVRWIPYVRSPASSDTRRRLGDLRLACEVHWAIDKDALPFAMRTTMAALGGPCNFVSSKGRYSFSEPQRIASATISFDGKTEAVPFKGQSFTPPLREQAWSDDSVIELQFENG